MKRIFVQLIIITTIFTTCLTCPVFGTRFALPVYAASGDITSGIAKANMVDAFKAYCKSRDMTIDGSILDAVDNFTSQTFEDICDTLGIDMTALQAQIQKVVDPNSNIIKYFIFTSFGINGFNRIFAQLLQDNNLTVGDEDVDKVVKSGKWWSDGYGDGAFLWVAKSTSVAPSTSNIDQPLSNYFESQGSYYKYDVSDLEYIYSSLSDQQISSNNYVFNRSTYFYFNKIGEELYIRSTTNDNSRVYLYRSSGLYGWPITGIIPLYVPSVDKYYLACCIRFSSDNVFRIQRILNLDNNNGSTPQDTDVKIVSPTIKPALPETPTSIAPDGRTSPDDQDPTEPLPDPIGGTPPDWSTDTDIVPDGDGWNIPFSLPDLDIDWSIQGLTNKFPFCIPFDLVNLIQVLDVNPRAPQIQGTINLLVYEWEVDMDFERFDEVAEIFRNLVYIGFVLGLIIITRRLIKG